MLTPSVLIPFLLSAAALVGFYVWYKRKIRDLDVNDAERPLPGRRLTAERLRALATPPWRVVFEVGDRHLGPIDHVVIGPTGVLAVETLMMDRPTQMDASAQPQLAATAAIARGDLDELVATVGGRCTTLVRVYWGEPRPEAPAGIELAPGLIAVEGQRLNDWLVALPPGPLQSAQVDQIWQATLTGIGRPDPLA